MVKSVFVKKIFVILGEDVIVVSILMLFIVDFDLWINVFVVYMYMYLGVIIKC